jgi:dTDP-glucose pyrophosphorylase
MMDESLLKRFLVSPHDSIVAALRRMDEAGEKILFVTDETDHLVGVVTDGDIRRWVLREGDLEAPISSAMNARPHSVRVDYDLDDTREVMISRRIDCLPVLDEEGLVCDAVRWIDLFEHPAREREKLDVPVVIMAGGEGNRLAPFTKLLPKPLVPVGDRPIVEHIMARFAENGCDDFYLSVNFKAALIKAYFSDIEHSYRIRYLEEERPLGTAGSLALLKGEIDDTFFVSNCDILIDADYADFHRFHVDGGYDISLIASMKDFVIPYGVCEIAIGGSLVRMVEKPTFNFLVSTGLYLLEPSVIDEIAEGERIDMTELMNRLIDKGKRIGVYPVSERSWMDMGQWDEFRTMLDVFGVPK